MEEKFLVKKLRECSIVNISKAVYWFNEGILQEFVSNENIFKYLSKCADPDLALLSFLRLCEKNECLKIIRNVFKSQQWAERLFLVLGSSSFYADFLLLYPDGIQYLNLDFFSFDSACKQVDVDKKFYKFFYPKDIISADDLRKFYWCYLLSLLADDLSDISPINNVYIVSRKISALVDASVACALRIAKSKYDKSNALSICVIAMGKTGGYELNYISDVDVIYLYKIRDTNDYTDESIVQTNVNSDENSDDSKYYSIITDIVNEVSNICYGLDSDSFIFPRLWQLDLGLRPEGSDGALARTLESCKNYYKNWAKDWEFQALLKARFMAGDPVLANDFLSFINPFVWNVSSGVNFVDNCRKMRARVENSVSKSNISGVCGKSNINIKLGQGGLRDIEFSVQLLQLVHGRADCNIRSSNTIDAIYQLCNWGYIARDKSEELLFCYKLLRLVEHRMQTYKMQRSQCLPKSESFLRLLTKSLKLPNIKTTVDFENFLKTKRHLVRKLHKDIFYSPILSACAVLKKDDFKIDSKLILMRLEAIGFSNPKSALDNIMHLTKGTSRRSVIQRHLLPVLLEWMSLGACPDNALLNFRILSETVGNSHWYLGFLRDSNFACMRLCKILSNSSFISRQLVDFPEAIKWLENDDDLKPRSFDVLMSEIDAIFKRYSDCDVIITHLRRIRAREFIRIAISDCIFGINVLETIKYVSMLNDLVLSGAYRIAIDNIYKKFVEYENLPIDFSFDKFSFAIFAMGRLGGNECVFSSDADVLYAYDYDSVDVSSDLDNFLSNFACEIASFISQLLMSIGEELPLDVDLGLRPEGNSGRIARSLSSYAKYFQKWTCSWERHALIRCRFVAGSVDLKNKFLYLVDNLRYNSVLSEDSLRQIRRLKARMDVERIPRSVKASRHIKFGRGGLCDVEWAVQVLQLKFAFKHVRLRTTNTLQALQALYELGIISSVQKNVLYKAWTLATSIRICNILSTGKLNSKDNDILPRDENIERNVNYLLGNVSPDLWLVEEQYLSSARQCAKVYEELFFADLDELDK